MRTTLNIEDGLYRDVKVKAAMENCTITQIVEKALNNLLNERVVVSGIKEKYKSRFPLVKAKPGGARLFSGMSDEDIYSRISELQSSEES